MPSLIASGASNGIVSGSSRIASVSATASGSGRIASASATGSEIATGSGISTVSGGIEWTRGDATNTIIIRGMGPSVHLENVKGLIASPPRDPRANSIIMKGL